MERAQPQSRKHGHPDADRGGALDRAATADDSAGTAPDYGPRAGDLTCLASSGGHLLGIVTANEDAGEIRDVIERSDGLRRGLGSGRDQIVASDERLTEPHPPIVTRSRVRTLVMSRPWCEHTEERSREGAGQRHAAVEADRRSGAGLGHPTYGRL